MTDVAIVGQGNVDTVCFVLKALENESIRRIRVVNCSRSLRKKLEKLVLANKSLAERIALVES